MTVIIKFIQSLKERIAGIGEAIFFLRDVFGVRLYEAIGDGGPMTLFLAGDQLYARTADGRFFNLDAPTQPLLVVGEELSLRPLAARERRRRPAQRVKKSASGLEKPSRDRRPDAR